MPEKKEKSYWATRTAIGSLFKAVTLSTDPAHTLGFSCSLINTSRAALIQRLEDKVPDATALPGILNTLLKHIANQWYNQGVLKESIATLDERIDTMFKSESLAKYGLEIYRDSQFCDDLIQRWKVANQIYIRDKNAWAISNDQLADVHKQLVEIIVRHDLMQFPKGEGFNLDERGSMMSQIASAMQTVSTQNGGMQ
jgi:hypothetical protein